MKTESQQTADLVQEFRKSNPTWVVLKHSDRFVKGIPDVSISQGRRTLWLERKRLNKKSQVLERPGTWVDNLVQLELLTRLDGWYHVYDPRIDRSAILSARLVRALMVHDKQATVTVLRREGLATLELELLITRYLMGEDVHL